MATIHVINFLLPYLDHRLDPHTQAQVESHLAECSACRAELAALREAVAALNEFGRAAQKISVNPNRGWAVVRARWQAPLATQVRRASRRLTWQVSLSAAIALMAFASGVSLNAAWASPTIPSIQTPGAAAALHSDTPTLSATASITLETPTLTLTPLPLATN